MDASNDPLSHDREGFSNEIDIRHLCKPEGEAIIPQKSFEVSVMFVPFYFYVS